MMASCGMRASWPYDQRKIDGADEREAEAHPVDRRVRADRRRTAMSTAIAAPSDGDLRQRQIHEDDPALDDMQAEVGVNAGEDQAGGESAGARNWRIVEIHAAYFPVSLFERAATAARRRSRKRDVVGRFLGAADRRRQDQHLAADLSGDRLRRLQIEVRLHDDELDSCRFISSMSSTVCDGDGGMPGFGST